MKDKFTAFVAAAAAGWAAVPVLLQALIFLTIIDVATGYMKAIIKKDLASDAARKGMVKKAMNFFLVGTGWVAHNLMGVPVPLDQILAGYLCSIEIISIMENFDDAGIKMPQVVRDILRKRVT
jgi:toxin secretion/phage lysis holin